MQPEWIKSSLEQSGSFTATHNAIERLSTYDDFTNFEIIRLLKAYIQNNQVMWILGDEDVNEFAKKIVHLAESKEAKALAVGRVIRAVPLRTPYNSLRS